MKIIETHRIGRLGLPIIEVYNKNNTLVYEAHDEIVCEFWSLDLLEILENQFSILEKDIQIISVILKKAWTIWANTDAENRLYDAEKFQQFTNLLRRLESEDRYLFIQEVVALLGKGVNRYGEKMRAMESLLDEKLDEIILYQGRGNPNAESLRKGYHFLEESLKNYCISRGMNIDNREINTVFNEIMRIVLEEEHMCIFKQLS